MKRTTAREIAIQLGFSVAVTGAEPQEAVEEFFAPAHYATLADEDALYAEKPGDQLAYILESVRGVTERHDEMDGFIARYSKGWRPERIDRAAAAILRQAIYEILYMDDVPPASSINEAVELAKGYADADVVAFINGVLGGFYRGEISGEEPPTAADSVESAAAEDAPVEAEPTADEAAEDAEEEPMENKASDAAEDSAPLPDEPAAADE